LEQVYRAIASQDTRTYDGIVFDVTSLHTDVRTPLVMRDKGFFGGIIGIDSASSGAVSEQDFAMFIESGGNYLWAGDVGDRLLNSSVIAVCTAKKGQHSLIHRFLQGRIEVDVEKYVVRVDGNDVRLVKAEFSLLCVLVEHAGRVHTREQLLEATSKSLESNERTIDVHVGRIKRKLKQAAPGSEAAIETVHGIGYRVVP
jgi:DNA-binding response OmpR family regulator